MKKILYSLIAAISFAGCSDLLDTEPLNQYTESVVWNDATLAQTFIYNTYNNILGEFICTPGVSQVTQKGVGMEAFTDNMVTSGWTVSDYKINIGSSNSDYGWNGKSGKKIFSCIRQTNVIIENASNSSLPETTKKEMIAQGKFLRALIYFKQVRAFGGYIIIDEVLDAEDDFFIPRSSIDETYAFIIKDLQEAAADLSTDQTCVHASKGAAYALLAEVALQAAGYTESGDKEHYVDISLAASEALFALGRYTLDDSYYNIFNNFGNHLSNSEIILAYAPVESDGKVSSHKCPQYRYVPQVAHVNLRADVAEKYPIVNNMGGVGGFFYPSQDMIDAYLVVDEDGVAKKWNETSYYANYKEGDPAADVLFHNRDSRFEASICHDETSFYGNMLYFRLGGNAHPLSHKSGVGTALLKMPVPYLQRKGINDYDYDAANGWGADMDYHYVLLRLGRSYLNYAEALLRKGKTSEAIEWINKTRTTHGDLPALSGALSATDAWEAYEAERRVEVYFEGEDRYWTLLRWHKYDGESYIAELDKDLTKYIEIGEDGTSFYEKDILDLKQFYEAFNINNEMVWDERKFLFPVPQSAIDESNGVIKQNPGW